ncbi:neuronal acetylcholine receptor subunit beta-3-like [Saccostrea cucullata]|uniref:neuronal acetylcholine receptor subunit beta-3-like n=1 Tax=Saccostrea cuccullata TaxID=36930 RepID=UPI002ED12B1B
MSFAHLSVIWWFSSFANSATLQDAENLHQMLKNRSEYDRFIVPLLNQSQNLEISLSLSLSGSDVEFIEIENKVKILVDITTQWKDETLNWDPFEYGFLYQLPIVGDWVWRPQTLIQIPQNDRSKMDQIVEGDNKELEMILRSDGSVHRHTSLGLSLFCSIDTTNFPFDKQSFSFLLSIAALSSNLKFSNTSACQSVGQDSGNPKWTNLQVRHEILYSRAAIKCVVSMERKPLFFVINIILPVVLLGFLEVLVFLIPADAGEKLSYSVALLLSYSVFISFVSDNIPEDSDNVSDLFFYVIFQFFIGSLIIFCTTLQLRLYHRNDEEDIPILYKYIVKFVKVLTCRCRACTKSKIESSSMDGEQVTDPGNPTTSVQEKHAPSKYRKTSRAMRRSKTRGDLTGGARLPVSVKTSHAGDGRLTWQNVSSAIDFVLFWVFLVVQVVLNLWFFYPAYRE